MAASWMCSGVLKSGWPMPRLMMSRPWAASAFARASTAKAFSSPMRSKFATVFSMAFPSFRRPLPASGSEQSSTACAIASALVLVIQPFDLHLGHAHHLEDDRNRPADQQQAVERRDRADQALALGRHRIAVAEGGVVLERELERCRGAEMDTGEIIVERPHADLADMRDHQADHRDSEQRGEAEERMQMIGAIRGMARRLDDDAGHERMDPEIEKAD